MMEGKQLVPGYESAGEGLPLTSAQALFGLPAAETGVESADRVVAPEVLTAFGQLATAPARRRGEAVSLAYTSTTEPGDDDILDTRDV